MTALREAYELIRDPARWTQGWWAKTSDGLPVEPNNPYAVRWCAEGALRHCDAFANNLLALNMMSRQLFEAPLYMVNDTLGHEAVMQVLEKVLVESEGGL